MNAHPDGRLKIRRGLIDHIEALVQEEVGRNISHLCTAAAGGLWDMASSIAAVQAPVIGVITGFYVPRGTPPAGETDGPIGAALLLRGLRDAGVACRLATDAPCRDTCAAALQGAGVGGLALDVMPVAAPLGPLVATWRAAGVTHALSIERCGRSIDGTPRNLRGVDISAHTAPMDDLFTAGPWQTLAIGDGGNEIGMGSLPRALIGRDIASGEAVACVTPARHLVVAGVSNWGAWGLLAALALLRAEWRGALLAALDPALDAAIMAHAVWQGPAVDGVTARQDLTVDGLELARHHAKLAAIRAVVTG